MSAKRRNQEERAALGHLASLVEGELGEAYAGSRVTIIHCEEPSIYSVFALLPNRTDVMACCGSFWPTDASDMSLGQSDSAVKSRRFLVEMVEEAVAIKLGGGE